MIRTYGLYWEAKDVFWGRQKNPGTLLGAASQTSRAKPVDFRRLRGIYALYAGYDLVYVGQTGSGVDRLFKRLKQHREDHLADRWDRFSWFGIQWVTKKHKLSKDTAAIPRAAVPKMLNLLEAVGTAISEPRLNLQRGRWGEATKYYQFRDAEKLDSKRD
jgi:hypothetical protein